MPPSVVPIYTIGCRNRSFHDFMGALNRYEIQYLLDGRSNPYSGGSPQFSADALGPALDDRGVRYVQIGTQLGAQILDNGRARDPFYKGVRRLQNAFRQQLSTAVMLSNNNPFRCYRRWRIAEALNEAQVPAAHIDEHGELRSHDQIVKERSDRDLSMVREPTQDPQRLLQDVFGHAQFRPMQREIIDRILARRSALVILSTGSGKSLCYQLPALIFDGLTVVVSPLISLMQDQVEALKERGIAAAFYNSTLSGAERNDIVRSVRAGQIKLLYIAPEGLVQNRILSLLDEGDVSCIAIDEAHCISQWGHDFRPEYRELGAIRRWFPDAVCAALTATATPRVQEDIAQTLGIAPEDAFVGSFDRENLFLSVEPRINMNDQIAAFLREREGQSGVIYCRKRDTVDSLCEKLVERGFSARPYHAGMESEERQANLEAFLDGTASVMVATIAFGMGIDKENVRFVLHAQLPDSPELYYQEIGRAGRDGERADCKLLFSYSDVDTIRFFIERGAASERRGRLERLNWLLNWAYSSDCRRKTLLAYFGEEREQERCGACDNCAASETPQDLTIPAQKFMSCIVRTGELFGEAYIIDVLKSSRNRRIQENRHHELSVFGIGTEFSKTGWQVFSFQLLKRGLIRRDLRHGSLKMTDAGWEVLRGNEPFMEAAVSPVRSSSGGASRRRAASNAGAAEYDEELFEKLRVKRSEIADEESKPAFTVFHDSSLREMASRFPQTEEAFLDISGVGPTKLEQYGDAFLQIIREHCQELGENESGA